MKINLKWVFLFLLAGLVGCATYQSRVDEARKDLVKDKPAEAAKYLEKYANDSSDDQLVYVFDYATALQSAGQYAQSNKAFQEANTLADLKNYKSISRIGGSILLNEGMVQYKGEDYENLLISVMTAINYLMLGDHENALVSIRQLNDKLEYYRIEEKKEYEQNTFALYLSGLLWESDRDWDSSYINYEKAYKAGETALMLHDDLVRLARLAGREEAYQKWMKEFDIKPNPEWSDKGLGEAVLIYQQGWGPRKYPRPEARNLPKLYPQNSRTKYAKLEIDNGSSVVTEKIYSVQDVAIKTLDDAYATLVAKRVAGVVAKDVVAQQVAKKNELLGIATWIALNATDQADLRQWSTLPETFQVARLYLPAGKYKVTVKGLLADRRTDSGETMMAKEIEIKPRKMSFLSWRSYR